MLGIAGGRWRFIHGCAGCAGCWTSRPFGLTMSSMKMMIPQAANMLIMDKDFASSRFSLLQSTKAVETTAGASPSRDSLTGAVETQANTLSKG